MARKRKKQPKTNVYDHPGPSRRKPPKHGKLIDLVALRKYVDDADSSAGQSKGHEGK